eukprot:11099466-Prorocentrum_lima.AAC.1
MTSSLVGSEMCIRDRHCGSRPGEFSPPRGRCRGDGACPAARCPLSVSYTHLTLPTSVDLGGR